MLEVPFLNFAQHALQTLFISTDIAHFMCFHFNCNGTYICCVCIINVSFMNMYIFIIVHFEHNKCALLNMLMLEQTRSARIGKREVLRLG